MSAVVYFLFRKGTPVFLRIYEETDPLPRKRGPNGMGMPRSKHPHNNHDNIPAGQTDAKRTRVFPAEGNVENSEYNPVDIRISLGLFHEA
jgi:hypothetical protein